MENPCDSQFSVQNMLFESIEKSDFVPLRNKAAIKPPDTSVQEHAVNFLVVIMEQS